MHRALKGFSHTLDPPLRVPITNYATDMITAVHKTIMHTCDMSMSYAYGTWDEGVHISTAR